MYVTVVFEANQKQRQTAAQLLKHPFLKTTKKTSCLVELIEKYKKWRRENGEAVSGSESDDKQKPTKSESSANDFWDLNTIRGAPAELQSPPEAKAPAAEALTREDSKKGSRSTSDSSKKKSSRHREGREGREGRDRRDKEGHKSSVGYSSLSFSYFMQKKRSQSDRPGALTSVIHPAITKVQKTQKEDNVIGALNELKMAFDTAEDLQPGITHSIIAQIIETLKNK
jgi:serine/threonine-protein kinase 24/25/MST4